MAPKPVIKTAFTAKKDKEEKKSTGDGTTPPKPEDQAKDVPPEPEQQQVPKSGGKQGKGAQDKPKKTQGGAKLFPEAKGFELSLKTDPGKRVIFCSQAGNVFPVSERIGEHCCRVKRVCRCQSFHSS